VTRQPPDLRRRLGRSIVIVAVLIAVVVAALGVRSFRAAVKRVAAAVVHLGTGSSDGTPLDSSAFSDGACEAFAPTGGDNGKTVFLDAGHGGVDPGGVGTTASGTPVHESEVNLAVELDTMALLRANGYRVVVSRTGDSTVVRLTPDDISGRLLTEVGVHADVVARDACANLAKADALVGIYMDAGGSAQVAGSVTLYDAARSFSQENQTLAGLLQNDVLSAMNAQGWQIPNDGAVPDSGYGSSVGDPSAGGIAAEAAAYDHLLLIGPAMSGYFTTPSEMPGAVIEPLYLTDPFEGTIAANPADQHIIAGGIAGAVEQFLKPATPSA
jgi:N-acetylmuramoyl-L-alanine amidase